MNIVKLISHTENKRSSWVLGLGDNNKLYYWNYYAGCWIVWSSNKH